MFMSLSSSAKESKSLSAASAAFVSPSQFKTPALMKHLTTVDFGTSFHAIAVHLIACRTSTDLQTSDVVLQSSTLLTTNLQDKNAIAVIRDEKVVGHMPRALASSKQGTGIVRHFLTKPESKGTVKAEGKLKLLTEAVDMAWKFLAFTDLRGSRNTLKC